MPPVRVCGTFYGRAMTVGDIYTYTVAGITGAGFSGDGGPGTSAEVAQRKMWR